MADMMTPEQRSALMGRIRSRKNKTTELRFMRILRQYKICGWRRSSKLIGQPDFVFVKARVVVFIDGDFWHGNPKKYRIPKTNRAYWQKKIERNRARDRTVNGALRADGWTVVRFWESDLRDEQVTLARLASCMGPVLDDQSGEVRDRIFDKAQRRTTDNSVK
jgi:DNA mismatch endonuclease (patch repair protein)